MTLSYDAGTFTLETREGTFEFVGRDIVSIEGRAKKTIVKLNKAGMPHMLRLAASNGFTYASTLDGYRQDSLTIDISGGGGTTDLFTNTTASQFVKTNSGNNGFDTINLFENTSAGSGVQMNSTNTGLERCFIKTKHFNNNPLNPISVVNIGIPAAYNEASRTSVIAIGSDSQFGNVLENLAANASNIISINSHDLQTDRIVSIGNYTHNYFVTHGTHIQDNNLNPINDNISLAFKYVCKGVYNATDSAKIVTITDTQAIQFGSAAIEGGLGNHTEYQFIVDNTTATGVNTLTLVFTHAMFVVPTPADLVVAAGKVAKFSLIVINNTKAVINKIF